MSTRPGGSLRLGPHEIGRIGYGAMQLEHLDSAAATGLLRRAIELGVNHLDTASFYPGVNSALRTALHPYAEELVIVSKVGARRVDAPVPLAPAQHPDELRHQVHQDLDGLGLERVPVVNLRRVDRAPGIIATGEDVVPLDDQLAELVAIRDEGLIGAIGLSNVTAEQVRQAGSADIVCVQNSYSLLNRTDEEVLEVCRERGIVWSPFWPLGSAFEQLPSVVDHPVVQKVAAERGTGPATVALAWLLAHHPHIALVPGTRSIAHLEANIAAGSLHLGAEEMARLDAVAASSPAGPSLVWEAGRS